MDAVGCFQLPSLLIGKIWVPVIHFYACPIHCRVYWRVGRRLGLCRLTSVQPLIGSTIWAFSISSALWVLEVLSSNKLLTKFISNRSQQVMVDGCRSILVNVVSGVSQGSVLGPILFLLYTFLLLENKLIGYADDFTLMAVVPSPGVRVAVAESMIRDLGRASEWCDLWGINLNASKTKTMIVSRSRTMHPQLPPLTIGGTVLKESDDLVILGVTFDSKMTFEKHLCSVSRAASQRLGILRKSWRVFHDRALLGRCFRGFVLPVLEYFSAVWCSAADSHPKLLDRAVSGARFLTGGAFECDISHRRSVVVLCMLYKIRCNPVYPLNGALPGPYVPVRVTRGALVTHRYTYAPPRC